MSQQFCSSCGATLMSSMRICPNCGGRSFAGTPPQVIAPSAQPSSSPVFTQPFGNSTQSSVQDNGPADRGTRLIAVILDITVFGLCLVPGTLLLSNESSGFSMGVGATVLGLSWLVTVVVQTVMLVRSGQSIGKRIMGIKIVKAADGTIPGFVKLIILRSMVPSLIAGIPFAGAAVILADSLMIFRDDKRCLHDMIAETQVVKV